MIPARPEQAHSTAEHVEHLGDGVALISRQLQPVGEVPQRHEDVLRVSPEVHDLACRDFLDGFRQRDVWEMSGEEARGRVGGEIRGVGAGVIELKKRDEVVGVAGDERVVLGDGVGSSVDEGEDDCLEPCGAGFGGGDEEDVVMLRLEVFLAGDDAVEMSDGVPETLILVEVSGEPAVLLWERGDEELEVLG